MLAVFLLPVMVPAQQIVRILAIRAEFQEDTSPLTTGNGLFDRTVNDSLTRFAIDPPPHDRDYFLDHLTFLKNYYEAVSNGRLQIDFDCYPSHPDSAYRLPHPMEYYSPFTSLDDLNRRLIELAKDAFSRAAQDPEVNWDRYDAFILFHAGVGQDLDLGLDETPRDIPSIYITREFIRKYTGEDGIPLPTGKILPEVAILPESESQGGYEIALNGMVVSQFGSFLGLRDLFNNAKKSTSVGIFDVMDIGLLNMNGLIPSIPMAWHRLKQGWVSPVEVSSLNDTLLKIYPYTHFTQSVYKIPVTESEYFLVEMRNGKGVILDSLLSLEGAVENRIVNYRQVLQKHFPHQAIFSERGVLIGLQNYDLSIPGQGILIWHVDEQKIESLLAAGKNVNDDRKHPGIDLMEADGSQDIGEEFGFLSAGSGSENGYLLDMFYEGNHAPMYKRNGNRFAPFTIPSSNSYYARARSGIVLSDFSAPGDSMTFRYSHILLMKGFPQVISARYRFMKSLKIQDQPWLILASSDSVMVYDPVRKIGGISLPVSSGERFIDALVHPGSDSRIVLIFSRSIMTLEAENQTISVTGQQNFPGEEIIHALTIQGYGLYLVTLNSLWRLTEESSWQIASQSMLSGFLSMLSVKEENSPLLIVLHDGRIRQLDGETLQEQISVPVPEEMDRNSAGLVGIQQGMAWDCFLYDRYQVWRVDFENSASRLVFRSESSIKEVVPMEWKQLGETVPVLALIGEKILLIGKNGSMMDYFPLNPNRFSTLTRPMQVVGSFKSKDSDALLAGVLAQGLVTTQSQHHAMTFSFYSERGLPSAENFFSLADSIVSWTFYSESAGNPWIFYVLDRNARLLAFQPEPGWKNGTFAENRKNENNPLLLVPVMDEVAIPAKDQSILPEELVYNWPNPAREEVTYLRFYLTRDARIEIKVYNQFGKILDKIQLNAFGGEYTDVPLYVRGYSTGVYYATIRATGKEGEKASKTIKIAVMK